MADPITGTLMAVSTVLGVGSQIQAGNAADKAARFEAQQLEQNADAAMAEGALRSYEQGKEGERAESDMIAAMVARGGSASDVGAIELIGKLGRDAEYNVLSELYTGKQKAKGLRRQASGRRFEGNLAKKQSRLKALSTALGGAAAAAPSFGSAPTG